MSYNPDSSIDKIISQYQNSDRLKDLFTVLIAEYGNLSDVLDALLTRLDIDLSQGVQLDKIGELVGSPRPLTGQIDPDDVFTFAGAGGKGFSGIGRPDIGGRFIGQNGLIVGKMSDEDYRILLKATIYANFATSDIDSLLKYVDFVLSDYPTITNGIGYIDLTYPKPVSNVIRNIIKEQIPLAAGIRLGKESYVIGANPFGFAGNSQNTGFGGADLPQTGSGFAGLIG